MAWDDLEQDYNLLSSGGGALDPGYIYNPAGDDVLHSSLANPLTTAGTYCKHWNHVQTATVATYWRAAEVKMRVPASHDGGALVDYAGTDTLSVRARVRIGGLAGSNITENALVSVAAFMPENTGVGSLYSGGHHLMLAHHSASGTSGVTTELAIWSTIGCDPLSGDMWDIGSGNAKHKTTCSGTYSANTWYYIRLDVVYDSATEKTLNAYTSDDDGQTWTLVGTHSLDSGDTEWTTTGYVGATSLNNKASLTTQDIDVYIDDLSVEYGTGSWYSGMPVSGPVDSGAWDSQFEGTSGEVENSDLDLHLVTEYDHGWWFPVRFFDQAAAGTGICVFTAPDNAFLRGVAVCGDDGDGDEVTFTLVGEDRPDIVRQGDGLTLTGTIGSSSPTASSGVPGAVATWISAAANYIDQPIALRKGVRYRISIANDSAGPVDVNACLLLEPIPRTY